MNTLCGGEFFGELFDGIDPDVIERCEAMYSASFRSEPEPVSTLDAVEREELARDTGRTITNDMLFCWLVSYKGEEEGFALYEDVGHLPVFRSKSHSAAFFGC
jgi:hypothetical protein